MENLTQGGEMLIDTYEEALALCKGHPSPVQHRMIVRGNRRYDEDHRVRLERLRALDGELCPLCAQLLHQVSMLVFIGSILLCPNAHAWSNPDVAEEEIRGYGPKTPAAV